MKMVTKKLKYVIVGFILLIIIIFILLGGHLNNIKNSKAFNDFTNKSKYEIVLIKDDNCFNEKIKLFKTNEYNVYGFCIKDVFVSYKNEYKRLEDLINNNKITIRDLINKGDIIDNKENIKDYKIDNKIKIRIDESLKSYKEIVFIS